MAGGGALFARRVGSAGGGAWRRWVRGADTLVGYNRGHTASEGIGIGVASFASNGCGGNSSSVGGGRGAVLLTRAASSSSASSTTSSSAQQQQQPSSSDPISASSFDTGFWRAQVSGPAVKQSARLMAARLDHTDPLGVDLAKRGATSAAADGKPRPGGRKTVYDYAVGVKALHPHKVLLIRVGEFYEAIGYDAVMLVMHAVRRCTLTLSNPR